MSAPSQNATPQTITPLRSLGQLPGPRPWPLMGNMPDLNPSLIHQDIENAAKRYGPMFMLHFGPQPVLVISDHEMIHGVLRARPDTFRRPDRTTQIAVEMGLDLGVFGSEGPSWLAQRRMVMASFSPGHVRAYMPSLIKVAQRLRKRWQGAAQRQESFDLLEELMRFTVDAITGLAFGSDVNTLETDGDVIQTHLNEIFPALFRRLMTVVPYWRVFKLPRDRRLDRSVAIVQQAIEGFVTAARERLAADPARRDAPPNLLEAMIVAADQEGSGVKDVDVAANVMTMLLAGEDTTANTMAWLIYLLHQHPELLARARAEVMAEIPAIDTVQTDQLDRLTFLDACIQETMRLKPVAPFLPLQAINDTVLGDVRVPAGTMIWSVLRGDSVSERYFERADQFNPERWLSGAATETGAASAKRLVLPFGAGPRVCPGRYLAMVEMKLCMATLLSAFEIQDVRTPDGGPAREHMSFTMGPQHLSMQLKAYASSTTVRDAG